ncbi:MAG: hypothetical protein GWN54_07370, partial [Gammaproteobacteria bacterium]|nr:hypothetical protein [Gammaproteobacteria bacterium]
RLIELMLSQEPAVPEDARSLARLHLKRIQSRVESALAASSIDDVTEAHLEETRARIERALDAQTGYQI